MKVALRLLLTISKLSSLDDRGNLLLALQAGRSKSFCLPSLEVYMSLATYVSRFVFSGGLHLRPSPVRQGIEKSLRRDEKRLYDHIKCFILNLIL